MTTPAIFENLVAYSVQAAIVAAIAIALPFILRVDAAALRYRYWRGALAVCILLPWLQVPEMRPVAVISSSAATSVAASASEVPFESMAPVIDWSSIVLAGMGGGALLRLLWIAVGFARLRRFRAAGVSTGSEYGDLQSAIGTSADVRYVPAFHHPVTFGVWRPVVLLPEALKTQPRDIRAAVVAHELVHVRRRDWLWVLGEETVRALFWFNPAIWLLISRVQLAREEVVDATVVATTGRRRAYVEALMTFADAVPLAPVTAFARRRHLFQRILLVTKENVMSARRLIGSTVVMVSMLAITVWGGTKAFPMHIDRIETAQEIRATPGPLELAAHPISPENPIPRRIYHQDAEYPQSALALNARASVTLRLTLDGSGSVAETRFVAIKLAADGFTMEFQGTGTFDKALADASNATMRARPGAAPDRIGERAVPAIKGFISAAVLAAESWRYEAPANPPIALDITFFFSPSAKVSDTPAAVPPPPAPPPPPAQGARVPGVVVPPPPPPPPPPDGQRRTVSFALEGLRVGGDVKLPRKVKDVRPEYPQEARAAGIQGVIIIEIRVDEAGRVDHARVLRSIPQLDAPAIDAVRQWEFEPTLLNGVATPLVMTVTVQFSLEK